MTFWLALIGAVAQVQSPPTPPTPPTPSPAAIALASQVLNRPAPPEILDRTARDLSGTLLHAVAVARGPGCDPENAACRAAAERLGREAAAASLAADQALRTRMMAIVIDDSMTAAEIVQATEFVRSPVGRSFAEALARWSNPGAVSPAMREKLSHAAMAATSAAGASRLDLFDRFHAETRSLPRRTTVPIAPPAPPPSSPPRRP